MPIEFRYGPSAALTGEVALKTGYGTYAEQRRREAEAQRARMAQIGAQAQASARSSEAQIARAEMGLEEQRLIEAGKKDKLAQQQKLK